MNRTIKDATVRRFHYDDHEQLRAHLTDFVQAYNFAKRLFAKRIKALKGLTPYESSAGPGQLNRHDSLSTRSTKCRDRTFRASNVVM